MANITAIGAFCLKITTKLGDIYGFTSFDCDLTIAGQLYQSNYAIDALAGVSEINLSVDNAEVNLVLDGNQPFSEAAIAAGVFSEARADLRLFNPLALPASFDGGLPVISGYIGNVTLKQASYTMEIRSVSELANRPITEKTSPKCPYSFGDSRCGLDLVATGLQFNTVTVTAVSGALSNTLTLNVTVNSNFVLGNITVLSGANRGLTFNIASVTGSNQITIEGEFADVFAVNDTISIRAFCKKDQVACKAYNNFNNFGGIPVGGNFMPGLSRIAIQTRSL